MFLAGEWSSQKIGFWEKFKNVELSSLQQNGFQIAKI